jgi:hypothetical protein
MRKTLLWVRKHQPVTWPREGDPHAPRHGHLVKALQAGFLEFDPRRKRFDPVAYVLTEAGRKALEP